MRRGLIAWSKEEVPPSVLEARVRRVQHALGAQGLDALLAYTSFPRPAAVSPKSGVRCAPAAAAWER